ncbi:MAG: FxsA family protein [Methylococcales bacterium]|nr:FxsA family protein [Methylococcales bacterium]MCK5924360.1 FxsA family protein [Methylococcales bacterium]
MKFIRILLLFFLVIPFIEIFWILQLGGFVGWFPTSLLVIFTAVLGTWLLRKQGFATWSRFQQTVSKGEVPASEMVEAALLLVGGAFLLTPGFFTDAIGFAFLIPQTRQKVAHYILKKYLVQPLGGSPFKNTESQHQTLDGEYKRED